MAFTALTAEEVASGKPITTSLLGKVRTNLDDHEARLGTVEGAANTYVPLRFAVRGGAAIATAVDLERIHFNMTLLAGRLLVVTAGTAGTAEVDIEYKRGVAAWASIFATRPSVAFGAGDMALSSNGVLGVTSLLAGDYIRLNITGVQTGCPFFIVYLEFQKT